MSVITEIAESLRNEFAANLREQKSYVRQQVNGVRREVRELREDQGSHHTETTRALAYLGDEMASLKASVELLVGARARRRAIAQLVVRAVTSTPGLIATATSIVGTVAAGIALL
jgi:hypothetical protein